ncbi:MAG: hypothetical protein HY342_08740 [Candidatus Lambdaproteobacteria bacterium]|nr:hypothetical protein [Candidatus Lambdaproteobacteria bacterium]
MSGPASQPDYRPFALRKWRRLRPLRRWAQVWLARGVLALTRRISVPAAQRLGRATGLLFHLLARKTRRICDYQLQLAMPELPLAERRVIVSDCFRQFGMTAWEALARPRIAADARHWVRIEDEAVLRNALARGRGVILLTAHTGNWELLSIAFGLLQQPASAVVRDLANSEVSRMLNADRRTEYFDTILRGAPDAPRKMLHVLRSGGVLIMAVDQDIDAQGIWVDFFGIPANTPRAPASLALKRGAPLVTAFDVRGPDGRHTLRFAELPVPTGLAGDSRGEERLTALISQAIEAHIRRYPSQWAWNHRRWKRRPPPDAPAGGEPPVRADPASPQP